MLIDLQISEHFLSESQNTNPLDAEPETDFNAKWPFKVIQGHLFWCDEEPLSDYIVFSNSKRRYLFIYLCFCFVYY